MAGRHVTAFHTAFCAFQFLVGWRIRLRLKLLIREGLVEDSTIPDWLEMVAFDTSILYQLVTCQLRVHTKLTCLHPLCMCNSLCINKVLSKHDTHHEVSYLLTSLGKSNQGQSACLV